MDDITASREHTVRRAILEALKYYKRSPSGVAEIMRSPRAVDEQLQIQEIVDQAAVLITAGYAENLKAGRGLLLRITPAGLRQIELSDKLDELIWGERAFQV